jgi:hypothetical protein
VSACTSVVGAVSELVIVHEFEVHVTADAPATQPKMQAAVARRREIFLGIGAPANPPKQ